MRIELWMVGKTENYIRDSFERFEKRIGRYNSFQIGIIAEARSKGKSSPELIKRSEAEKILNRIEPSDYLVLLDEKGKQYTSIAFAEKLNNWMGSGKKRLVFLIGGAYGFSDAVYKRSDEALSLSAMTFSHQIIRVLFIEQLYRGFTILNNEPYHHS